LGYAFYVHNPDLLTVVVGVSDCGGLGSGMVFSDSYKEVWAGYWPCNFAYAEKGSIGDIQKRVSVTISDKDETMIYKSTVIAEMGMQGGHLDLNTVPGTEFTVRFADVTPPPPPPPPPPPLFHFNVETVDGLYMELEVTGTDNQSYDTTFIYGFGFDLEWDGVASLAISKNISELDKNIVLELYSISEGAVVHKATMAPGEVSVAVPYGADWGKNLDVRVMCRTRFLVDAYSDLPYVIKGNLLQRNWWTDEINDTGTGITQSHDLEYHALDGFAVYLKDPNAPLFSATLMDGNGNLLAGPVPVDPGGANPYESVQVFDLSPYAGNPELRVTMYPQPNTDIGQQPWW